jgi:hypothetical protein
MSHLDFIKTICCNIRTEGTGIWISDFEEKRVCSKCKEVYGLPHNIFETRLRELLWNYSIVEGNGEFTKELIECTRENTKVRNQVIVKELEKICTLLEQQDIKGVTTELENMIFNYKGFTATL